MENSVEQIEENITYLADTYARFPVCIEKGKGALCRSPEGFEYVDFTAGMGVNTFGFCDEEWIEAITAQAKNLQHISNSFFSKPAAELARLLTERTTMKKVFFCNSGAEANEAAIKLVRKHSFLSGTPERNEILTLEHSFHGRTLATLSATGQEKYHNGYQPLVPGFTHVQANNLEDLKHKISCNTAAIMLELIQGEGGIHVLEPEFVKGVESICKELDLILIVDEVQTGIGRTGRLFACEGYGIQPDLITFAKGIAGGLPLGGLLIGEHLAGVFSQGDHGSTFGGNPVCCAGAISVLNRLTPEFLSMVREKGRYMADILASFQGVKQVTGAGLMLGIEIEGQCAKEAADGCVKNGLLVLTAGDKLRLLPPLSIKLSQIDRGLEIIKKVLGTRIK